MDRHLRDYIEMFVAATAILLLILCSQAQAMDIDAIIQIESSGNPAAWNKRDDSRGLMQITPIVLKEYNDRHDIKFTMDDLFSPSINMTVGVWYMEKRIPQMLKHYKIPDTPENRIIAYNAGISYLVKKKQLPSITIKYIEKYKRLTKGNPRRLSIRRLPTLAGKCPGTRRTGG